MKLIKKIIPFLFLASLLAGCNNSNSSSSDVNTDSSPTTSIDDYVPLPAKDVDSFNRTYVKMDSNSLYVNKVENLSEDEKQRWYALRDDYGKIRQKILEKEIGKTKKYGLWVEYPDMER